jgi:hypothetical protein
MYGHATFWLHIDTAETTTTTQFDKLTVKWGTTTVATFSNLNKTAGTGAYLQRLRSPADGDAWLHRRRGCLAADRSSWTTRH